jgi:hypothetical protein
MTVTATRTNTVPLILNGTRITWGTFTDDNLLVPTGNINTGLTTVVRMKLMHTTAVAADKPVINETFPCDGSAVTIVVTANSTGIWEAEGS